MVTSGYCLIFPYDPFCWLFSSRGSVVLHDVLPFTVACVVTLSIAWLVKAKARRTVEA
jgi:hypothetical protein